MTNEGGKGLNVSDPALNEVTTVLGTAGAVQSPLRIHFALTVSIAG